MDACDVPDMEVPDILELDRLTEPLMDELFSVVAAALLTDELLTLDCTVLDASAELEDLAALETVLDASAELEDLPAFDETVLDALSELDCAEELDFAELDLLVELD